MNDDHAKLFSALDPVQRRIIKLGIQNVNAETIANVVKRSLRTVRREIRRFEEAVERQRVESA